MYSAALGFLGEYSEAAFGVGVSSASISISEPAGNTSSFTDKCAITAYVKEENYADEPTFYQDKQNCASGRSL